MVDGHELHGLGRQDARPVQRAPAPERLEEAGVIHRRGDEPRAAREALARALQIHALPDHVARIGRALHPAFVRHRVHDGEPVRLLRRHVEVRVHHAQRLEDLGPQEGVQGHARCPFDHHAQDIRGVAVHEGLARLGVHGQDSHALHGLGDRLVAVGEIPAHDAGLLPALGARPPPVPDAGGVREQVAHRDIALGGNRLEAPVLVFDGDGRAVEFGDEVGQVLVDQQATLLLQDHHAHRNDRLGLRSDAEEVRHLERIPRLAVPVAEGPGVDHVPAPADHERGARQFFLLDVRFKRRVDPGEPFGGDARLFRAGGSKGLGEGPRRGGRTREEEEQRRKQRKQGAESWYRQHGCGSSLVVWWRCGLCSYSLAIFQTPFSRNAGMVCRRAAFVIAGADRRLRLMYSDSRMISAPLK